jgi:hypothetical protein
LIFFAADYAHDIRQLDAQQAMNYGEKLQNESLASLDRSLASIDDSTKVWFDLSCQSFYFSSRLISLLLCVK